MSSSNATCYFNDGSVAKDDYFCGLPHQDTCCGRGWSCLSNGLCTEVFGSEPYAQGSCADPSFDKCLSFCNYSNRGNYTVVDRCEQDGNSWCFTCHLQEPHGPSCCDTNLTTSLEPYPFTVVTATQPRVGMDTSSVRGSTLQVSSSTTSIPSVTELSPSLSSLSYPRTFLDPTSETSIIISTQSLATPSGALTSSPSTPSTNHSHDSRVNINVGITIAIFVILLAIVAFFIFQNRKFKRRLLQLREGPSGQEETTTAAQEGDGNPPGELRLTLHELAQQDTPRHELYGNEIYELYHRGTS